MKQFTGKPGGCIAANAAKKSFVIAAMSAREQHSRADAIT